VRAAIVNLTGGGMSGGYRKYLLALVPLLRRERDLDLEVYVPPDLVATLAAQGLSGLDSWPRGDQRRGFRGLRAALGRMAPDVVFVPSARLLRCGRPCVVMVRNMEPLERPFGGNPLGASLRNLGRAWAARRACVGADRVIAVSHHVADFITRRFGVAATNVGVVYHGVEPPTPEPGPPPALAAAMPGRFLFTAGSIRPARGLEDAILALRHLGPALPLVVAGEPDPDSVRHGRRLRALAARQGVAERIIWAGALGAREMSWAYAHCAAFIMTSRTEACPNTVLEALSHGAVSVSVDHPPMNELFADAAFYYRRTDAADLARRLGEALALQAPDRSALSERARRRASLFTWARTAELTRQELERALG
jgi:glycosyltransferase involved in cell wall biosynthesis